MVTTISRPTLSWSELWDNLNVEEGPDIKTVETQTMVRMGSAMEKLIALEKIDVKLSSFSAQELAEWLCEQTELVGKVEKYDRDSIDWKNFKGKRGIMFIKQANGGRKQPVDHIDLWDGAQLRKGDNAWIRGGQKVWFWELEEAQK
jgi:hypothetical protein